MNRDEIIDKLLESIEKLIDVKIQDAGTEKDQSFIGSYGAIVELKEEIRESFNELLPKLRT